MLNRLIVWVFVLCTSFGINMTSYAQSPKMPVVASFSILADLVQNVGGNRVEVQSLVGAGGDAHVYAPTPQDVKTVFNAKLVFVNGFGFEGWIDRLIQSSGTKAAIITATKGIVPLQSANKEEPGIDPHAWQNIANVKIYVANIRDALIVADSAGKAIYEANATTYLAKLDALETFTKTELAKIPADKRKIITSHDAFGYFGKAYGFEFIAPQGVSTETEASAKDVARIIRQIKVQKIPAVFIENISDKRLIERIGAETGAKIGGSLFSDALSDDKGKAVTYSEMVHNNVIELVLALQK